MRNLLSILLVGILSVSVLSGCGGEKDQKDDGKLTIGISIPSGDHGWTGGVVYWAGQAMKDHPNVNWEFVTADNSGDQIRDIEQLMAQKKLDGIVILAHESAPLTPIAKKAKENGIYIVNVDRGFTEPVADVFIEGDNEQFGRESAEFVVEKMGGKGNLVIIRGAAATVDTIRYDAAMEVFQKHPEIRILNPGGTPGNYNKQVALDAMKTLLETFPDIDAIWAQDDDMAEGIEIALKEKDRIGKIWIFGGAGKKEIVKRVMDKDPLFPADITYPPAMIAAGIHTAVYRLGGIDKEKLAELLPKHLHMNVEDVVGDKKDIKLEVFMITPENARDYYFPDSKY